MVQGFRRWLVEDILSRKITRNISNLNQKDKEGTSVISQEICSPKIGLLTLSYSFKSTLATSATLGSLSEYSVQAIQPKVLIPALNLANSKS